MFWLLWGPHFPATGDVCGDSPEIARDPSKLLHKELRTSSEISLKGGLGLGLGLGSELAAKAASRETSSRSRGWNSLVRVRVRVIGF